MNTHTKQCIKCKIQKNAFDFNRSSSPRNPDGLQAFCRDCSAAYYLANKVKHKMNVAARNKRIREENVDRLIEFLKERPCIDCGEAELIFLEFDHVRGQKFKSIGRMISDYHSWESILDEIAKCEVRCVKCHRRKTANQFGWRKLLAPMD